MCTLLARVGRRHVCIHFDRATVAAWEVDAVGHGGANPFVVYRRTAQFVQAQAWLPSLNSLARTHLHLYKPGSPLSVMKELGKSTSQPRSHD